MVCSAKENIFVFIKYCKGLRDNSNLHLNRYNQNQLIEIFSLKDLEDDAIFSNYQRYDFYQLLWFTNVAGDSSYFLDFNEYTIENNQIVLVFPGQIDRLDVRQKEGYLFTINNDILFTINQRLNSDYLNGYFSNVFISLNDNETIILENLLSLMVLEYADENRITLMQSYMEAFLFHVASLFEKSDFFKNLQKHITDPLVAGLMRLIDANFIIHRETDFYANSLGLTNRRLNEISMKGTGKTVKQHLQERLILEIKKEIRLHRKNLKEIAFDLGFSEPAYFTRFFKLHTGQTPSQFRDN